MLGDADQTQAQVYLIAGARKAFPSVTGEWSKCEVPNSLLMGNQPATSTLRIKTV